LLHGNVESNGLNVVASIINYWSWLWGGELTWTLIICCNPIKSACKQEHPNLKSSKTPLPIEGKNEKQSWIQATIEWVSMTHMNGNKNGFDLKK
jgi:hypothetical protein